MASKIKYLFFILFIFLALGSWGVNAQNQRQQELEGRRRELQKEIKQITALLFASKKERKSIINTVDDLSYKISVRKNLIRITNQQANLLTREINFNENKILDKQNKLKILKQDYAAMILRSYKSRDRKNKLMFLLSSSNFQQAFRRIQYIKQYANYQKNQAKLIKEETKKLQLLNQDLESKKEEKKKIINENQFVKEALDEERNTQKVLIASIQKDLSTFSLKIKNKQKESQKLNEEIRKLIQEAIAASNRKAGKSENLAVFSLTPEQKALAKNFTSNKGKLPWPVANGIVKLRFGTNPSPIDPSIKIRSNGVRIATNKGEPIRSVFEGTVQGVMTPKNGNNTIMIRHGNYITVYKNLSKFYVSKGDKVTTKQIIGEVITNKVTGESILSFGIYKDSSIQNPSSWIYKL
ncbi:MAG: peptidase M23 [Flavobacteriaceae bacterium]|nr:peptidase M23 [Flavobacteriaceae bacterium]|tara:strand:+ start:6546 stop:7775 length:1230 start_codon:yes stop_codon:yes gene_type:complete